MSCRTSRRLLPLWWLWAGLWISAALAASLAPSAWAVGPNGADGLPITEDSPAPPADEVPPQPSTDPQPDPVPAIPVEPEPEAQTQPEPEPAVEPTIDLRETLGLDHFGQWLEARLAQVGLTTSATGRGLTSLAVLALLWLSISLLRGVLGRLRAFAIGPRMPLRLEPQRLGWYQRLLFLLGRLALILLAVLALMVIWLGAEAGANAANWIVAVLAGSIDLAVLLVVAAVVFELASATIEHYISRWSRLGSSRLNTLLPIARNVAYGTLLILFGLTFLSELGINVMPLLAGAGVVGFAVGFGAQTFVKDLITGFIIIFEDLIQVGDVVAVGGHSGAVERITIRKVQLRGLDGTVFTVPFGSISTVANLTKDFSFYVLDVAVDYRESPDKIIELLKQVASELKADPEYHDDILDPMEILGVDKFGESSLIVKARIKTLPIRQWKVGREFNRRLKYMFDQHQIAYPFPHRTLYFGENMHGHTPAMHVIAESPLLRAAEKSV